MITSHSQLILMDLNFFYQCVLIEDSLMKISDKGMTVPLKSLPSFRRRKDEPEHVYMNRVDRETTAIIKKDHFENKYKVDQITVAIWRNISAFKCFSDNAMFLQVSLDGKSLEDGSFQVKSRSKKDVQNKT